MKLVVRARFFNLLLIACSALCLKGADFNGKFTLPYQTKLANTVLPPGDYTFRLDDTNTKQTFTIRQGNRLVTSVMSLTGYGTGSTSGPSFMTLVQGRIRSLHLAAVGRTYTYGQPKHENPEILARSGGIGVVALAVPAK